MFALEEVEDEKEFRDHVLGPLLRNIPGIKEVQNVHGKSENGIDFLFRTEDEFQKVKWKGIQAKVGRISGGGGGDIGDLKDQAKLALRVKHPNSGDGSKNYITEFYIATEDEITDIAKDNIRESITNTLKGSIYFLDGQRIIELANKHMSSDEIMIHNQMIIKGSYKEIIEETDIELLQEENVTVERGEENGR